MRILKALSVFVVVNAITIASVSADSNLRFDDELLSLQQEFDRACFAELGKSERKDAFAALVSHAAGFGERYPDRVEARAWNGIILSTYAGEVSALSAMKYAKAAREALTEAEAMNPTALDGGIYASLGALYSKVPGGLMGFGDDTLAAEYFAKALEVDDGNIDNNYFFGEFLLSQGRNTEALTVLQRALVAPADASRPLFDSGRRRDIRELIDQAERALY